MAMRQRQWSFGMSIMGWWSFTVITMGCGCMGSGLSMITMSGFSMSSDSRKRRLILEEILAEVEEVEREKREAHNHLAKA